MTVKLYENDSYIKEFEAVVISCRPDTFNGEDCFSVVLDKTAFFPEGGGQSADIGTLNGKPVYDVQIKEHEICHLTSLKAEAGEIVAGELLWEQRFSNMQQHSGEHIFSGLVHQRFGYNNVGFHLGSQAVTMDFNGVLSAEDMDAIEWAANGVITQNVRIFVDYPDKEALKNIAYRSKIEIDGQVRLVTVEGYDVCACCAPHVARTGEIGGLKVIDFQKYKGGTRVSILCGFRALMDHRIKQGVLASISRELSSPPEKCDDAVLRLKEDHAALRQVIYSLREALILSEVQNIDDQRENVWLFKDDLEAASMRKTVNLALDKISGYCGVFCGNEDDGYKYIIGTRNLNAADMAGLLKDKLGARGGGSAAMVQGFVGAGKEAILHLLPK